MLLHFFVYNVQGDATIHTCSQINQYYYQYCYYYEAQNQQRTHICYNEWIDNEKTNGEMEDDTLKCLMILINNW